MAPLPHKPMPSPAPPITIIASTNRPGSLTAQVAAHYATLLQQAGTPSAVLCLTALPADFTASALYERQGKTFAHLQAQMTTAQRFVFIVPEYNGSFPGVLKVFLDGLQWPTTFKNKKCALIGLSKGPQGAALALSHLTDIFHHPGMHVHPLRPKLANIHDSQLGTILGNDVYAQLLADQAAAVAQY